ncbi:MAG TPA: Gfo/Idh/MocA family oxidoreductase, partial [Terriglobales bacterium]|nr:Gfo/Idh/MocA family oxidoreductase [Terriglobales bacterium]
ETHARAANAIPEVSVVAIYGTNQAKVAGLAQEHAAKPYTDFEAFLNHRPLDLVTIGSPSGLHAAQGIAAAKRGLHVLTEKPIDISTQRADELIAAAESSGVKLGVMFQDRCKPDIRRMKQWIDEGVLGKVLLAEARVKWYRPPEYYSDSKWRGTLALDGGGALINQGVHTVDLLLWMLGDVVGVQARTANLLHKIEAEDTALALLEFESGANAVLEASTAAFPGYPRRLEITGTEGTMILEQDRVIAVNLKHPRDGVVASRANDNMEETASPVVTDFEGHRAVFEDFVRAIKENDTPMCDGREARRSLALIEEIYRAAGRGKR